MSVMGDKIACVVLEAFDALPKKRKPQVRKDAVREWVPLSGIVAEDNEGMKCIALGTGMKCLPASKIPQANGTVLHDWHAEIVAIRAFNRFLLEECKSIAVSEDLPSRYVRRSNSAGSSDTTSRLFTLKDGVKLYMYCSEAPCGDSSMELTMAAQNDSTPWDLPVTSLNTPDKSNTDILMNGRGFFSQLGTVRRKPSRPDAPPTLSKSCSDKIALHQCTSLLSSLTSLLISPENAYIRTLVLPESQYSAVGCERCFGDRGRLAELKGRTWEEGYRFRPFEIVTTQREFGFSRRGVNEGESIVPSNLAAVWMPDGEENLIGGVLQGRKVFDPKGASMLSNKKIWELVNEIVDVANCIEAVAMDLRWVYSDVKNSKTLKGRRTVKDDVRHILQGWTRNTGDDSFSLEDYERSMAS